MGNEENMTKNDCPKDSYTGFWRWAGLLMWEYEFGWRRFLHRAWWRLWLSKGGE